MKTMKIETEGPDKLSIIFAYISPSQNPDDVFESLKID